MAVITGTDAGESIQDTPGDDTIYGLGGDDRIDGDDGSDSLYGGDGNDWIREVSSDPVARTHQMFGEAGDDLLELDLRSNHADTVLLDGGTGNDHILFDAWYMAQATTILGGDGDDFIHVAGGKTVSLDAGSGADRIELDYSNLATAYNFTFGAGADVLELLRTTSLTIGAAIHVTDFEAGAAGDRINFDRVLASLTGSDRVTNPFASGHLALVQRGADAVVQIDLNGGGNDLRDLFVLEGVNAATLTSYNLGFAPNGGASPSITADGTSGADILDGSGGNDLLRGLDGDDKLSGGYGNDQLEGGIGADRLEGGFGDDVLLGGQGNDTLFDYNSGSDQLFGDDGDDFLEVGRTAREPGGTIVLDGGAGNDTLQFGLWPFFRGTAKADHVTFIGGDGNDGIRAEGALTVDVDAGAGADTVDVAIDGTTNFITLGSGADTLSLGAEATKQIVAAVVRDFEAGNSGDRLDIQDYLEYALTGWNGQSNPFEGGYLQRIQRGADAVLQIDVDGAAGPAAMTDLVIFKNLAASSLTTFNLGGYATLTGTEGNDVIEGDGGANTLHGLGGNDTLIGNGGDDLLDGGAGDDIMSGGYGADIYIVSEAGDQVIEPYEFVVYGGDEVRTSLAVYTMPANVERLVGTSSTGQTLTTSSGVIIGSIGNDILNANGSANAVGGGGADLIKGSADNNTLVGGEGSDTIYGYGGDDRLYAGTELSAAIGGDYLDGGDGNDHVTGSLGTDILIGGGGDDVLYDDDSGADLFDAGDGNDELGLTRFSYGPAPTAGAVSLLGGAGDDHIWLVVGNASTVTIDGGDGNDEVEFATFAGTGTVTLGAGADVIRFSDYTPEVDPNARITITDFDLGAGGDTLSWTSFLQGWLTGWDPSANPFLSGHIRLGQSGASTVLQLDRDGGGDGFITLLTFQNTNAANFTAAQLGFTPRGAIATVGGDGNDIVAGTEAGDLLDGGAGNDTIWGGSGADTIGGGDGSDTLFSADRYAPFGYPYSIYYLNNPTLDTGNEADTLRGGAGSDYLFAGFNDSVDGGDAEDVLYLSLMGASSGVTLDFRQSVVTNGTGTIRGIEGVGWLQGSDYADDFTLYHAGGYAPGAVVYAMGGNDRVIADYRTSQIFGGDGDDFLDGRNSQYLQQIDGGADNDTIYTNANSFTLAYGGSGNDTIYSHGETHGGSGNDRIILSQTYYRGGVYGDEGDDEIRASANGNQIAGGAGADRLIGDDGVDLLVSGDFAPGSLAAGNDLGVEKDVLTGGGGDDVLAIGWGDDADGGSGTDTLQLSFAGAGTGVTFSAAQVVGGGALSLGGGTIQNIEQISQVLGSSFDDAIDLTAASGTVTVDGADGSDSILGGGGNDTLRGGEGDDRVEGGSGSDTLQGDGGQDWLISGNGGDTITGGTGHDTLWGDAGDDLFDGGDGDDVIAGGAGIDTVTYASASGGVEIDLSWLEDQQTRGAGIDTLISIENVIGSNFDDVLAGNAEANRLTGGLGNDRFVFDGLGARDTITDFQRGDLIDLSEIDANGALTGDGSFAFIGAAAFSGVAGQLRVVGSGFNWTVEADTDGNGVADFSIALTTQLWGLSMSASDFSL
ncbi:beta strand repeat-containing protein [Sphingomonas sp. Sphisp140]|uniref:beta strand repeat-containing protein n=1 Tax=unclassified Sphingomonas TaxID=196159 RepID=UPI0039AF0A52